MNEITSLTPIQLKNIKEVNWKLKDLVGPIVWEAPTIFTRNLPKPTTSKSVQVCPAAVDFDARYFVIRCPENLTIRLVADENRMPILQTNKDHKSDQNESNLNSMTSLTHPNHWRHKDRPIVQISTPYVFWSEDVIYLNISSAFMDYRSTPLPGVTLHARFPINPTSNQLVWAFEWHDIQKEIVFKKGDPWFYIHFETCDPSRKVRLIQSNHLVYID